VKFEDSLRLYRNFGAGLMEPPLQSSLLRHSSGKAYIVNVGTQYNQRRPV